MNCNSLRKKSSDITVEVVLCTYNGARFVYEQLCSISNQTHIVNKISIYDDGSTDSTLKEIERFVVSFQESQKLLINTHINRVNLGYAKNFSQAIENSTEDIIFLCDQDDIWVPNKVECLLSLIIKENVDMVFSDGILVDENGNSISSRSVLDSYELDKDKILSFYQNSFEYLMKRNYVNGAAAAIKREVAQSALPLPCDMPHDYWLALWCACHNGISATPETLYRYRQHENNVIGIGSRSLVRQYLNYWRYSDKPREREKMIWDAVVREMQTLGNKKCIVLAKRKMEGLNKVIPDDRASFKRLYEIIKSIVKGEYRCYSPRHSVLRDLSSFLKHLLGVNKQ